MQSNPRILANLPAKPNLEPPIRCILGGGPWGGWTPPTSEPLPTVPIFTDFYRFLPIFRTFLARQLVISVMLARLSAISSQDYNQPFTGFSDFLGRLFLVVVEVVFTVDYLYYMHVFFPEIVLWRNHLINRVELFEEKSILVFPECLEASEW